MGHPQDRYTKPQISEQQTREDDCDLEHLVGKSNEATIGIEEISTSADHLTSVIVVPGPTRTFDGKDDTY